MDEPRHEGDIVRCRVDIGDQCFDCIQFDWCPSGRKDEVAKGELANPDVRCMFVSEEW